jgi:hypothetical protein
VPLTRREDDDVIGRIGGDRVGDAARRWEPTVAEGSRSATQDVEASAGENTEEPDDVTRRSSSEPTSRARGWMQREADERTSAMASRAKTIADAMRQTSSKLQEDGQDQSARMTEAIADRVERVAGYLDQADGERLLNDAQDFTRRNRWAVTAAGLVVGFAASRFVRAPRSSDWSSRTGATSMSGIGALGPGAMGT